MRIALLLLPAFLAAHASAADGERPVASKVSEVKVFLSGAQVARTASATIPAGSSVLVFTGLSERLDPQSIQVTGKGGYRILSVNHRMNHLAESPMKKEIEELRMRIKKLDKDLALEKAMQDVWANEEQLLNKNSAIGGQQNGLTAAQLAAVNDYVRQRLTTAKTNWLAQQEKLAALQEEKQKLAQQMQQYQAQAPRPTSEVVVEVSSDAEAGATFALSYFTGGAGWLPAYDLRAKGVGQPIELLMKAAVTNGTGEDWNRVALGLSSGNPTLGGVMPGLAPWVLYRRPLPSREVASRSLAEGMAPAISMDQDQAMKKLEERDAIALLATLTEHRTTTVEFAIEAPFTIPADGKPHTLAVKSHSLQAQFKHYATPKLDKDAFLYARTTGWEDLDLLPGEANVFFEGTYVGRSYLQLDQPKDTLDIALGRDKGVVVERVRRKDSDEKALIGGKRTVTIGWDLTVRNNKGTAIDLEVRDQYPLSPQGEIEVKLTDRGGAAVDDQKGLLAWSLRLEPKATRKLGFSYEVRHPKDMPVVLE